MTEKYTAEIWHQKGHWQWWADATDYKFLYNAMKRLEEQSVSGLEMFKGWEWRIINQNGLVI